MNYFVNCAVKRIETMQIMAGTIVTSPKTEFTRKELEPFDIKPNWFSDYNVRPDREEDFVVRTNGDKVVSTRYYYNKATILNMCYAIIESAKAQIGAYQLSLINKIKECEEEALKCKATIVELNKICERVGA